MTRFLIIGFGRMGRIHYNAVKRMPDADIAAVIDPTFDEGDIAEPVFRSFSDACEMAAFDACIIASPTKTHADYGAECIKKQIPVLIEKPVTRTLQEARELDELRIKHGDSVFVSFTERFNPVIQAILPELRNKAIRNMTFSRISHRSQNILSDGLLQDIIVHDVDLARFLTNNEIVDYTLQEQSGSAEQQYEISLSLQNNISAKIHSAVNDVHKERRFMIQTDEADYEGDLLAQTLVKKTGNSTAAISVESSMDAAQRQLTEFIQYLQSGTRGHLATLHDGIRTLEVIGV